MDKGGFESHMTAKGLWTHSRGADNQFDNLGRTDRRTVEILDWFWLDHGVSAHRPRWVRTLNFVRLSSAD